MRSVIIRPAGPVEPVGPEGPWSPWVLGRALLGQACDHIALIARPSRVACVVGYEGQFHTDTGGV